MKVAALLFNTSSRSEPTSSILGYCVLLTTWVNLSATLCDNYFFLSANEEVLPLFVQNMSESGSWFFIAGFPPLSHNSCVLWSFFLLYLSLNFFGGEEGNLKTTKPVLLCVYIYLFSCWQPLWAQWKTSALLFYSVTQYQMVLLLCGTEESTVYLL